MNSLEYTSIQGFKLVMRALLGGTFLPVQRTCNKKAKFFYRFFDLGRIGPLRALPIASLRWNKWSVNPNKFVCKIEHLLFDSIGSVTESC